MIDSHDDTEIFAGRVASEPGGDTVGGPDLGHLPGLIGYMLRRAQLAVFQDFARAHADFGLRPAQYAALTIIERNPGLKQKDVSEALGIKRANFVAMCDELERLGLAERQQLPSDRRSYALYLTGKGKALLRKLHPAIAEHERKLVALIGGDGHARLIEMLTALATFSHEDVPGARSERNR
jgi:DNA-binding MarR family transcriptional regulator